MAGGEVSVRIAVVEEFAQLARDLRRMAAKSLQKELYAGLQRAARPAIDAVKANARNLPSGSGRVKRHSRMVDTGQTLTNAVSGRTHKIKRRVVTEVRRDVQSGGAPRAQSVADRVAGARYQVRPLVGRSGDARIRLQATEASGKKIDLYRLDQGRLRHKTFGRGTSKAGKSLWFDQAVEPGWFSRPIEARSEAFKKELQAAVDKVVEEINRG